MPVQLDSKLAAGNEARIEVIPLIDIMFFLLAAFMLVSLSMVNLKRIQVNLPASSTASNELRNDIVSLSVDKTGVVYLDKNPIGPAELTRTLRNRFQTNPNLRVIVSGDGETRYNDLVLPLDAARAVGIQNVALETRIANISQ
jgi:biopolymer transport protein ExbD